MRRENLGESDEEAGLGFPLVAVLLRVYLGVEFATCGENQQTVHPALRLERVSNSVAAVFAGTRIRAAEQRDHHCRIHQRPASHVLPADVAQLVSDDEADGLLALLRS